MTAHLTAVTPSRYRTAMTYRDAIQTWRAHDPTVPAVVMARWLGCSRQYVHEVLRDLALPTDPYAHAEPPEPVRRHYPEPAGSGGSASAA